MAIDSIDWTRLSQVRDRQKLAAQETVARERQATEQALGQVLHAQAHLQSQHELKRQLWQQQVMDRAQQGFSVADLRHTSAWSRSLDTQIAQAADTVRVAQQQAALQHERLLQSREHLRAASAELEKTEQMQQRARSAHRRLLEARLEDTAEEVAVQTWVQHHFSRAS